MKGIIFNLLEEVVTAQLGDAAWDDLLASAELEGAYTSLGNYSDEELRSLVAAAAGARGESKSGIERQFGRAALPLLAGRYPAFFNPHTCARSLILTLNDIIHPEVRKLYPGADVPVFSFQTDSDQRLVLGYRSQRRMCALAEGLIEGAADYFGETAVIEQPSCMSRGDGQCTLVCTFQPADRPRS